MNLQELISFLEQIAPAHLQESYDNAGLICGYPDMEIKGVLVCLDSTEKIIDEAIEKGCNVVVAHHPIVFRGLKQITGSNYIQRVIIKAIKNDVAIYAIHTNLDNVYANGVNAKFAEKLGLKNTKILSPKAEDPQVGSGMVGDLEQALEEGAFLHYLKNCMQTNCIRHTELTGKKIQKVALCGGSGSFLLSEAKKAGADVFVSGDFKYHEFFDAEKEILIADIGHFESEQFTIELLHDLISQNFSNFAAHYTGHTTNPVHYFV